MSKHKSLFKEDPAPADNKAAASPDNTNNNNNDASADN